jgi:hypothetical protein
MLKTGKMYTILSRRSLWKTEQQGGSYGNVHPEESDQFMCWIEEGELVFYICNSKTHFYTHKVIVHDQIGWVVAVPEVFMTESLNYAEPKEQT